MVKRCQWGLCNSDSRYPDRLDGGVTFIPFPKPKRKLEKCKRWIKACGRRHEQLNTEIIDGNYHMFVCTKHFPEGKPTEKYPDPIPVGKTAPCTPVRPPPKRRPISEPPCTKKRRLIDITNSEKENIVSMGEENAVQPDTSTTVRSDTPQIFPEVSALELLALAAENRKIKQTLSSQILQNEDLRRNIAEISSSNKTNVTYKSGSMNVESLRDSPIKNNFKYYTGFVYLQFMNIFKFLVPNDKECPFNFTRTISSVKELRMVDQLLLTMVKLRLNFEFKHLVSLFQISPQDAGALFKQWINYMFYRFGSVPMWPERDILIDNMPPKFKEGFPNTLLILDGTEIKVEKPSSLRSQSQCYSDYKSATTLKSLVGIDPRGSFTFILMLFSGSISDKQLTVKSGLLQMLQQLIDTGRLKQGDGIMVDKGFLIREEIENLGLKLYIPPFAPSSAQMPASDVALTRKIAKHRVHVERAISRAKKFKIVDNRVELSLFHCINQIWFCCCFLTGFMPFLIND